MSMRRFLRRRQWDRERVCEIEAHLAHETDRNIARGLSPEEARRQALIRFGNPTIIRERIWQMNSIVSLENFWRDVCYAARQLRKSPGISLVAIATLALGIGANTAVFTLTWAVILKGLPVPQPEQMVEYVMDNGRPTTIGLSGPMYEALGEHQKDCAGLLAWTSDNADLRSAHGSERVHIQLLSGSAFRVLEIRPYIGNFFGDEENRGESAQAVPAVLSYSDWLQRFHGDPDAVGRSFFLDNFSVTVVGVMPKGFEGLTANFHPAVYVPLSFADLLYGQGFWRDPRHFGLYVLGRLKPGMTVAAANDEVKALEPAIRREADSSGLYLNDYFKDFRLRARSGRNGISWVEEVYSRPLIVLELLVVFLLVLTCLNTALVMLARVSGREHEYAVRNALGAGRQRLIAQVLTETLLLIFPGLLGGLFSGWGAAQALVAMLGGMGGASSMNVRPNGIILGFNVGISLLVAFGAGLWPALRASRTDPISDLRTSDRSVAAKQLGGWVVAAQVAVSVSLVTSAVVLVGTLGRLLTRDSGLSARGTALATLYLPALRSNPAEKQRLTGELLRRLQRQPGVIASGVTGAQPLSGYPGATNDKFALDTQGNVHSDGQVLDRTVSPNYFKAIGTRLLTGESSAPVAQGAMAQCVLSYNLASRIFPGENAVGRMVYASTPGQPDGSNPDARRGCLVVGVAENARLVSLRTPAPQIVYNVISPDAQSSANSTAFAELNINLVVHAESGVLAIAALHNAVNQLMPGAKGGRFQTFRHLEDTDLNRERMLGSVSGVIALLALLLTALGLYGLLMRSVVLRTREIGVRVALGAKRAGVVVAIARRAMTEIGIGLFAGLAVTVFLMQGIRRLLGSATPADAGTYLAGIGLILLVSAVAIFFPARRAISVDPMRALRIE
jgi:predicted permease